MGTILNDDCPVWLTPTSASSVAAGGTGSFDVSAATQCSWAAASDVSWITLTSEAGGSGNGSVEYAVEPNASGPRSGQISAAAETFTIHQDGVVTFTNINAYLIETDESSADWGDYDSDGDLDILLTGAVRVGMVYRNDGSDTFFDIDAGLIGVHNSSVAWGDYNNDGDLDILLTGDLNNARYSKVYRNDGSDTFIDIDAGLIDVYQSSVAWGDYDNDGDLDILLTGDSSSGRFPMVYRNDGGGVFADISAGLTGVSYGSVAWGDYDNDGDLDILLTGDSSSGNVSRVYRNDDGGTFTRYRTRT